MRLIVDLETLIQILATRLGVDVNYKAYVIVGCSPYFTWYGEDTGHYELTLALKKN